jgi:23S rRNA (pseudouridine1915-N3)-methyltransferase
VTKISLIQIGKTHFGFVDEGFEMFENRLKHYCKFSNTVLEVPGKLKSSVADVCRKNEAELLLKHIKPTDFVVLLDEKGNSFASKHFAQQLQKWQNVHAHIVFVIGGAFGFHPDMYERAQFKVSLSDMTFSHQLIRLIFIEQLYRAYSIIKGEPYHN